MSTRCSHGRTKPVVLVNVRRFTPEELEYCHDVPFGAKEIAVHTPKGKGSQNRTLVGIANGGFVGAPDKFPTDAPNSEKLAGIDRNGKVDGGAKQFGLKSYLGLILAFFSAICFSAAGLTSKMLAAKKQRIDNNTIRSSRHFLSLAKKTNHPFNIALWKYHGMTILGPILLIYFRCIRKDRIFDSIWPLNTKGRRLAFLFLIVRGTVGVGAMISTTYALKFLKLADTTVIVMSTPIAVTLFARVCLRESCGFVPIGTAFLTLIGVGILMRPPILTGAESFDVNTLIGTAIALLAMLFITSVFLLLRFLRTVHFSLFIFFYSYVASIESIILGLSFGVLSLPQTTEDYWIAGVSALLGVFGQLCITFALKYENASPVSLIRTSEIVFSFLLQFWFLGVTPDWLSLVGASIVLTGLVITTLRKWVTTLPPDHKARRRYKFLLV